MIETFPLLETRPLSGPGPMDAAPQESEFGFEAALQDPADPDAAVPVPPDMVLTPFVGFPVFLAQLSDPGPVSVPGPVPDLTTVLGDIGETGAPQTGDSLSDLAAVAVTERPESHVPPVRILGDSVQVDTAVAAVTVGVGGDVLAANRTDQPSDHVASAMDQGLTAAADAPPPESEEPPDSQGISVALPRVSDWVGHPLGGEGQPIVPIPAAVKGVTASTPAPPLAGSPWVAPTDPASGLPPGNRAPVQAAQGADPATTIGQVATNPSDPTPVLVAAPTVLLPRHGTATPPRNLMAPTPVYGEKPAVEVDLAAIPAQTDAPPTGADRAARLPIAPLNAGGLRVDWVPLVGGQMTTVPSRNAQSVVESAAPEPIKRDLIEAEPIKPDPMTNLIKPDRMSPDQASPDPIRPGPINPGSTNSGPTIPGPITLQPIVFAPIRAEPADLAKEDATLPSAALTSVLPAATPGLHPAHLTGQVVAPQPNPTRVLPARAPIDPLLWGARPLPENHDDGAVVDAEVDGVTDEVVDGAFGSASPSKREAEVPPQTHPMADVTRPIAAEPPMPVASAAVDISGWTGQTPGDLGLSASAVPATVPPTAHQTAPDAVGPMALPETEVTKATAHLIVSHAEDRAEVLLEPAELGRLRFEVTQRGDTVQILLTAERPETLDLLRRNADQLLNDLKSMGFSGSELGFGTWGQSPEQRNAPVFDDTGDEEPAPIAPQRFAAAQSQRALGGGLDLRL